MRHSTLGTWLVVCLALLALPASAENSPGRMLKENTFIRGALVETAFLDSYLGLRETFLYSDLPRLSSPLGIGDVTLVGFKQLLEGGVKIRPWLGLDLGVSGFLNSGASVGSLLRGGALGEVEGRGGLLFRLLHSENTGSQVTAKGYGGYAWGERATLSSLVGQLLDSPVQTAVQLFGGRLGEYLLAPTHQYRAGGGLRYAQALGKVVSLQMMADLQWLHRVESPFITDLGGRLDLEYERVSFEGAGSFQFDFHPVPLAVQVEYRVSAGEDRYPVFEDFRTEQAAGLGLYLAGQPNLQFGISADAIFRATRFDGFDNLGNPLLSEGPRLYSGNLVFQYIW